MPALPKWLPKYNEFSWVDLSHAVTSTSLPVEESTLSHIRAVNTIDGVNKIIADIVLADNAIERLQRELTRREQAGELKSVKTAAQNKIKYALKGRVNRLGHLKKGAAVRLKDLGGLGSVQETKTDEEAEAEDGELDAEVEEDAEEEEEVEEEEVEEATEDDSPAVPGGSSQEEGATAVPDGGTAVSPTRESSPHLADDGTTLTKKAHGDDSLVIET